MELTSWLIEEVCYPFSCVDPSACSFGGGEKKNKKNRFLEAETVKIGDNGDFYKIKIMMRVTGPAESKPLWKQFPLSNLKIWKFNITRPLIPEGFCCQAACTNIKAKRNNALNEGKHDFSQSNLTLASLTLRSLGRAGAAYIFWGQSEK